MTLNQPMEWQKEFLFNQLLNTFIILQEKICSTINSSNWSGYFNKWLNEFQKRKNIISIHHLTEMVLAQQTQNQKKTNL